MHIIGEVITNLFKNRVLTLTSIFSIILMLILVGVFGVFLLTLSYNSEYMDDMLEIRIFINPEADDYRISAVEDSLMKDGRIEYIAYISKEQAFEDVKKIYDKEILEGLGPDFLPASYTVRLKEDVDADNFVSFAENLRDVYRVDFHQRSFDFAANLSNWVNIVAGSLSVLLGILSLFLVSNTIRLTMAGRSDEVIIMKFIGATEARIKKPFILEGVTIGFIGALIASLIMSFAYSKFFDWFGAEGSTEVFLAGLRLVPVRESVLLIYLAFFGISIVLGMLASQMAIRRHLKV
ncbi:MAG: ABC transporter permease [Clostridia bacterium]|nr:ABC transporter permease [Clostridia bacterium]